MRTGGAGNDVDEPVASHGANHWRAIRAVSSAMGLRLCRSLYCPGKDRHANGEAEDIIALTRGRLGAGVRPHARIVLGRADANSGDRRRFGLAVARVLEVAYLYSLPLSVSVISTLPGGSFARSSASSSMPLASGSAICPPSIAD